MPDLRKFAVGAGLLALTACAGYQSVADPGRYLADAPVPVSEALVTLKGNRRVTFLYPEVVGDSLLGTLPDGARWRVALADVTRFELPASVSTASDRTEGSKLGRVLAGTMVCVVVMVVFRPESCTVEADGADE